MIAGCGVDDSPAAGGPARHVPVLLEEVIAALEPKAGGVYLDGTFGAGGYSQALLAAAQTRVLALDRDPAAIAHGAAMARSFGGRLTLIQTRFGVLDAAAHGAGFAALDGVVLDVGVSSMQIDEAARGFSFRQDGPLDMRMGLADRSAADIVNADDAERIADILYYYGEERASRRIARAIVADRVAAPFTTTRALAEMIARVAPAKPTEIHPATRSFQALRIAVNDELGELVRALVAAERVLAPGGVLAVVSFHSLEDRIVKQFFKARTGGGRAHSRLLPGEPAVAAPTFAAPAGPIIASAAELANNPRARAGKLRFARRTDAPARAVSPDLEALCALPDRNPRRR